MEDAIEWPESPDPDTSEKNNNSVLKTFILLYEQLPELWNSASPSYLNKYKRNEALANLLVIYKEIKADAKVVDVRIKINTLRSNVGSFIYPWIPIPATQNSDQRCAPTFPTYASELRCSFFLLKF